jgi:pyridoxamine 5'-phosphate oxidase
MPDFGDPLGLLVHCHEKIEWHLGTLERVADVVRAGVRSTLPAAFAAADKASAHFAVPGVKHTEDEEASLFPRLRERGGEAGRDVLAAVEELEAEHRAAERLHTELDAFLAVMPRDGSAAAHDVDRLSEIVARLCELYRPHLRVENDSIFPVAARVLSKGDLEQLGAEMYARRRVLLRRLGSA